MYRLDPVSLLTTMPRLHALLLPIHTDQPTLLMIKFTAPKINLVYVLQLFLLDTVYMCTTRSNRK